MTSFFLCCACPHCDVSKMLFAVRIHAEGPLPKAPTDPLQFARCPRCWKLVSLSKRTICVLSDKEATGFEKGLWAIVPIEEPLSDDAWREEFEKLKEYIFTSPAWRTQVAILIGMRPPLRAWAEVPKDTAVAVVFGGGNVVVYDSEACGRRFTDDETKMGAFGKDPSFVDLRIDERGYLQDNLIWSLPARVAA